MRLYMEFDRTDCTSSGCATNGSSTTGTSVSATLTPTGTGTYRAYYALQAFVNGSWTTVDQTSGYQYSFTSTAPTATLTVNLYNVSSYWPPSGVTVQLCRDSFMSDCIATRTTTGTSQQVSFTNVPYGTYNYRVTTTPTFTPRQTEWWGDQTVSVTGNTTNHFTRFMPYIDDIQISCATGTATVRTRNPSGTSRSVYVSIIADRSRSAPWDRESRNANHSVGANSTATSSVVFTPSTGSGTYYLYIWLSHNSDRALDQIQPWTYSCVF